METTQSQTLPRVWLDLLPLDVCERIAAHVSHGQQTESALALAQTSAHLGAAVVSSFSHNLRISSSPNRDRTIPWLSLAPYCKSLRFTGMDTGTRRIGVATGSGKRRCISTLNDLIIGDNVETVDFWLTSYILLRLWGKKNVSKLIIRIFSGEDAEQLFLTLKTMDVKHLHVYCKTRDPTHCPFSNKLHFNKSRNALSESCPNLETLQLSCYCFSWTMSSFLSASDAHNVWSIFPQCKKLKSLVLPSYPPQDVLSEVCKVRNVKPFRDDLAFDLAMRLKSSIMELECSKLLSLAEINKLSVCTRLRSLDICIDQGTETALPTLIRQLPELRSLKVRMNILKYDVQSKGYVFNQVQSAAMLQTVLNAPKLDTLNMVNICISKTEIKQILIGMGTRLRDFMLVSGDEGEIALQMVEVLLYTAAQYNTDVRKLIVSWKSDVELNPCTNPNHAIRVYRALDCLLGRAPFLDKTPLENAFRSRQLYRAQPINYLKHDYYRFPLEGP